MALLHAKQFWLMVLLLRSVLSLGSTITTTTSVMDATLASAEQEQDAIVVPAPIIDQAAASITVDGVVDQDGGGVPATELRRTNDDHDEEDQRSRGLGHFFLGYFTVVKANRGDGTTNYTKIEIGNYDGYCWSYDSCPYTLVTMADPLTVTPISLHVPVLLGVDSDPKRLSRVEFLSHITSTTTVKQVEYEYPYSLGGNTRNWFNSPKYLRTPGMKNITVNGYTTESPSVPVTSLNLYFKLEVMATVHDAVLTTDKASYQKLETAVLTITSQKGITGELELFLLEENTTIGYETPTPREGWSGPYYQLVFSRRIWNSQAGSTQTFPVLLWNAPGNYTAYLISEMQVNGNKVRTLIAKTKPFPITPYPLLTITPDKPSYYQLEKAVFQVTGIPGDPSIDGIYYEAVPATATWDDNSAVQYLPYRKWDGVSSLMTPVHFRPGSYKLRYRLDYCDANLGFSDVFDVVQNPISFAFTKMTYKYGETISLTYTSVAAVPFPCDDSWNGPGHELWILPADVDPEVFYWYDTIQMTDVDPCAATTTITATKLVDDTLPPGSYKVVLGTKSATFVAVTDTFVVTSI